VLQVWKGADVTLEGCEQVITCSSFLVAQQIRWGAPIKSILMHGNMVEEVVHSMGRVTFAMPRLTTGHPMHPAMRIVGAEKAIHCSHGPATPVARPLPCPKG